MKLEPIRKSVESFSVYVYVCMYVCMCACVCVCAYVHICVHAWVQDVRDCHFYTLLSVECCIDSLL